MFLPVVEPVTPSEFLLCQYGETKMGFGSNRLFFGLWPLDFCPAWSPHLLVIHRQHAIWSRETFGPVAFGGISELLFLAQQETKQSLPQVLLCRRKKAIWPSPAAIRAFPQIPLITPSFQLQELTWVSAKSVLSWLLCRVLPVIARHMGNWRRPRHLCIMMWETGYITADFILHFSRRFWNSFVAKITISLRTRCDLALPGEHCLSWGFFAKEFCDFTLICSFLQEVQVKKGSPYWKPVSVWFSSFAEFMLLSKQQI